MAGGSWGDVYMDAQDVFSSGLLRGCGRRKTRMFIVVCLARQGRAGQGKTKDLLF